MKDGLQLNMSQYFLELKYELPVTVNIVLSLLILFTTMTVVVRSYETSVLTKAARRYIPEDGILHSHCREILNSYIAITCWSL
jgi:hypothetical protein